MPIKFPKFSRRKSAGNTLEAAYEPANPGNHFQTALEAEDHDGARDAPGSGYGGFRGPSHPNRGSGYTSGSGYSGQDYYADSNRLSYASTVPSGDFPQTPVDHRLSLGGANALYGYSSGKPLRSSQTFNVSGTPPPPETRSPREHPPSSPRRNTMSIVTPPRLDTSLDTSSIFGDDMFNFTAPKDSNKTEGNTATPTAPRQAVNPLVSTDNYDITPVPPPKSYDPASSPTAVRFPGTPNAASYTNSFTVSQHTGGDRPLPASEYSPYQWDSRAADEIPSGPAMSNNSPRTSRNLTPGQSVPRPNHSRNESLSTPGARPAYASRQNASKLGSGDSMGLKRHSAVMRRTSIPVADEDAAIVASATISRHAQEPNGPRPQPGHVRSSPPALESMKSLSDRVKDRDSGWEESASSSGSSMRADNFSLSSKETATTSPVTSRGNADSYMNGGHGSITSTPKAKKAEPVGVELRDDSDSAEFDPTISMAAALAAEYENNAPQPSQQPPPKVMTRAQFELYQQQQDDQRRLSGRLDESDNDSEVSESEDEEESQAERNRMQAKQRAKQDAHLSVYRQQMMKITGTEPSELPIGMQSKTASVSTPALPIMTTSGPSSSGKNSDEDEDEEIPLGILMAHGFPNRNRPPTRLSNASSQPNLRAAAQSQLQDPRLPPFARNLPMDPYNIGAGLINPMNRMSLAFGGGSETRSNSGGSIYNGMAPSEMPGRHPQGLVGEILKAEEMKAARKGNMQYAQQKDPFRPDPFARPSSPGVGMHGFGNGMMQNGGGMVTLGGMGGMGGQSMVGNSMGPGIMAGMPGMAMHGGMGQGGITQGDQAQMQMANQMQQMMQMQMQWMQIQMQMQNSQQQQSFPQGMMAPPQRPASMMSVSNTQGNGLMPSQPRAMSMVGPPPQLPQMPPLQPSNLGAYAPSIAPSQRGGAAGGMLGPPGYTPSIAPSERSTVGLPSRYRPVSFAPGSASSSGARTATLTSTGADWNRHKTSHGPSHLKQTAADSDDDDESGWEELNKKREEKKSGWRQKKESTLKGMLHFGTAAANTAV